MAPERLFELRRRTFDGPEFRGMEFIEVEARSIINKVPGNFLPFKWTINPYRGCSHACSYCFARTTHTFLDMSAGRDFETKIVVKVNAPELLRAELRPRRWCGEHIAMGTATDPYQRAEGRYRLMPPIIEALTGARNPFSILTKGTLILRDLDLLKDAARVADVSTAMSIPTLDEHVWRASEPGTPHPRRRIDAVAAMNEAGEPGTPHPRRRIDAVAAMNEAGIPCGVMLAPILPGLSDDPKKMGDAVRAAVDAGATHVTPILLHLRPVVREEFMGWLDETYPHLVTRYEGMYASSPYGPKADRAALSKTVSVMIAGAGGIKNRSHTPRFVRPPSSPNPKAEQLTLYERY